MRRLLFLSVFLVPATALALTIQPASFYRDVRASAPEAAGINMLSREGIVKGYGNGIFGLTRQINRAEFLKIAMIAAGKSAQSGVDCFPDVRRADWFSPYVCPAKDMGVVRGMSDGRFHPEYTVSYGEALKMLTLLFGYDIGPMSGVHWADPYYRAAAAIGVDLPVTISLDTPLTRGLAARLTAAFLAESKGQLAELRLAESGQYAGGSTTSSSSSPGSNSSSSSSSSSFPVDPISNTSIRSQFLLLGETGPVIGSVKIFIQEEPIDVTKVTVNITQESQSLRSIAVYDASGRLLGSATLDRSSSSNRAYSLDVTPGVLSVMQRGEVRLYFRPQLLAQGSGGIGNELVQISTVSIKANGVWSSAQYTKASTDTFLSFVTSRSTITSVKNALATTASLIAGSHRTVGAFTFEGRTSDHSAHIDLTDLVFDVSATGGASLSNVELGSNGTSERFPCTVNASQVTCASIPDQLGSLTDDPRTLTVFADVSVVDPVHASLQLTLNDTGSPFVDGSVSWSDGTTEFHWVAVDAPVASGTYYRY